MFIYMLRNRVSGKCYIGQTTQGVNRRLSQHRFMSRVDSPKSVIALAIKKHGWEAFDAFVLEFLESRDELNDLEKYWIKRYDTQSPNGYNVSAGGDGSVMSIETREKLRIANLGKTPSEATRQKISNANRGRPRDPDAVRRSAESQRGRVVSDETRAKLIFAGAKLDWQKVLARGAFSAVYEGTRPNTVIKVTIDEIAYYMLNDCMVGIQHKNLPRVVRNYGDIGSMKVGKRECTIYMFEMEKLEKLANASDTKRLAAKISDRVGTTSIKHAFHKYNKAFFTFEEVARDSAISRGLRNAMQKIADFCSNFEHASPDLHMGNMMQRANGDLVIIDPICNSQILNARVQRNFAYLCLSHV